MRAGASFESPEVADYYEYRPGYPDQLFHKLTALSQEHACALDLGCGTGRMARRLCHHFDSVLAVDPSDAMQKIGQQQQPATDTNINWLCSLAEDAPLGNASFDLVVAAASIHWMDHARLFEHLRSHLPDNHVFAVVNSGDEAYLPPWQRDWEDFLSRWIFELTGQHYQPRNSASAFSEHMQRYKGWVHLEDEAYFTKPCLQSVDDFIACQHSRDTFTLARLGARRDAFVEELRDLVSPHADQNGKLSFVARTHLEWGTVK